MFIRVLINRIFCQFNKKINITATSVSIRDNIFPISTIVPAKPNTISTNILTGLTKTTININYPTVANFCTMANIPIVTYETIKNLPKHPEILLVDVREVQEIKDTGSIPTSINVPLNDVQRIFSDATTSDNFDKLYNRKKPTNDQEIIFSCRSGMRAGKAATMLVQLGYTDVKNYQGSWIDWAEHEGLIQQQ